MINYDDVLIKNDPLYPDLMKAFNIVKDFIIENKLIIVGGMALDYALKLRGSGIYDENELPDYDLLSPDSYQDSIKLGIELCNNKLQNVSIIRGYHIPTTRVRVENVGVADLSYCPKSVYDDLNTIMYEGFRLIHPYYQLIDQHNAFAYPYRKPQWGGNVNVWKKYNERIKIVLEFFPLPDKGLCNIPPTEYSIEISDVAGLCIAGYSAHPFYYNDVDIDGNKLILKMYKNEIILFSNTFNETVNSFEKKYKIKAVFYNAYLSKFPKSARIKTQNYTFVIMENDTDYISATTYKIKNNTFCIISVNWTLSYYLFVEEFYGYKLLQTSRGIKMLDDEATNKIVCISEDVATPVTYYGVNNLHPSLIFSRLQFEDTANVASLVPKNLYPKLECNCDISGEFLYDSEYYKIDGQKMIKNK
jgi:hypothetical protein